MNIHLHLSAQMAGIIFANAYGAVMFLCHLYNALQKEGLLKCCWPDLDMIISNHSATRVFVDDRPTDNSSCYMHFCLAIGMAASQFASDRNARVPAQIKLSPKGPRTLNEDVTPVTQFFQHQLAAGLKNGRDRSLLGNVETMLNAGLEKREAMTTYWGLFQSACEEDPSLAGRFDSATEKGLAEMSYIFATRPLASVSTAKPQEQGTTVQRTFRHRFKTRKVLSPVELIETLLDAVSYELPMLKMDYFSLHRSCWTFLRSLNDELRPQLRAAFPQGYLEREQQLPYLVGHILQIASGSKQVFWSHMRLPLQVANSRVMTSASVALSGFLLSGMGSIETTRLIHGEKSNMRLADIEFSQVGVPGSVSVEKEATGSKIFDSNDEEVSMSMIEAMAQLRS